VEYHAHNDPAVNDKPASIDLSRRLSRATVALGIIPAADRAQPLRLSLKRARTPAPMTMIVAHKAALRARKGVCKLA